MASSTPATTRSTIRNNFVGPAEERLGGDSWVSDKLCGDSCVSGKVSVSGDNGDKFVVVRFLGGGVGLPGVGLNNSRRFLPWSCPSPLWPLLLTWLAKKISDSEAWLSKMSVVGEGTTLFLGLFNTRSFFLGRKTASKLTAFLLSTFLSNVFTRRYTLYLRKKTKNKQTSVRCIVMKKKH